MNRSTPCILLAAAAAALVLPNPLAAQGETYGTLLSLHVPCREAPSHAASVVSVFRQTGDAYRETVSVRDSAMDAAGTTWVSVRRTPYMPRLCWVPEALVGPWREPESLLAMADRLLASPDGRPLEDWVAVYSYFRHRVYREVVDASPVLSLRRLEVLMRALEAAQPSPAEDPDPRALAWLESLGADVEALPDRARLQWVVGRGSVDSLYEAHRDDPLAEEILWRSASQILQRVDCGLSVPCVFDGVLPHAARYWRSFPDGRFVDQAISASVSMLRRVQFESGLLGTCEAARTPGWDAMGRARWERWDELAWQTEGRPAVRRLLATLSEVGEENKAPLVDYINRVERCASEVPAQPPPDEEPAAVRGEASVPSSESREMAITAPGVLCRFEPSRTARGGTVLRLDEHFTTEYPDTVAAGETWVSASRWGRCWIPGAATAPAHTHDHVLAIADRFLTSGEGRTPDHSLRVYNVLGSRVGGHREIVDTSAILSLRRLQILGEVLKTFHSENADALLRGWADQLVDDVYYWSIGSAWYVRDEAFERAYEEHRESPDAEEILWELVTGPSPHDCEGDFACTARAGVRDKFARYWTDYPRGRYVGQAITISVARLGGFPQTCNAARGAPPGSRDAFRWERAYWEPRGAEMAAEIRATLADVPPSDGEPLTTLLDGLEACAAEVGSTGPSLK